MRKNLLTLFGCLLLVACGIDPKKIPSHELYSSMTQADEPAGVSFAIVGSTRSVAYGTKGEPKIPQDLIDDLRNEGPVRGLSFVVLTGGHVRRSSSDEWKSFARRWGDILRGETISQNKGRIRVVPLVGDGEYLGDPKLQGYGAAFPNAGEEIGYNRVASWSSFDVKLRNATWRFVVVDTHRRAMGSRWDEQLFWLPKALDGDDYDRLLVFMPEPLVTLAEGVRMNRGGAPEELQEIIEDHTDVLKLAGIVHGGTPTNEVFLPSGNYGELLINAGNGGIGSSDLRRWGPADEAGLKDVSLEPLFDLALLGELDKWAQSVELPERVIDRAKARGAWETYTGVIDGGQFPIQGYWIGRIAGINMELTFRMRRYDGTFHDVYRIRYTRKNGWQPIGVD